MKIGNPAEKPPLAPVATNRTAASEPGKAAGNPAPQAGIAEAGTTVELSTAATRLLSGAGAVSADFDSEKVSRVAQAIAEGKFEVNAGAIADKLLANAREVLGKSQH
jgi:negative regulator of flagellin synthesis FlgM